MFKNLVSKLSLALLLSATAICGAQALPTASGRGNLQIGAGASLADPDYSGKDIEGISGFADFDFAAHFGVEANLHYIALNTPTNLAENTYLIGPRAMLTRGRFTPYAKGVIGIGSLVIQPSAANSGKYGGTYLAYGFGGGVDIRAARHVVVRAIDFEYQKWPGLGHGLSPFVVTVGVAYTFR